MKHKIIQKFDLIFLVVITIMILLLALSARAQTVDSPAQEIIASGGTFTLEKAVTAGGGVNKTTSPLSEHGTTGQAVAGEKSTGGNFTLYHGFWTPEALAPTAAAAVVGGQILTATGKGIKNVRVTITFPDGQTQTTVSSSSGYYQFADIPVGEIYIISVMAKRYKFTQPIQVRQIMEDTQDINFIGELGLVR